MKKQLCLLLLIAMSLFFHIGCGADVDRSVTFYRNEAWKAEMKLGVAADLLAFAGSPQEIEAQIEESIRGLEALGAKASWELHQEDTTLIYAIHVEGEGFDILRDTVFNDGAQLDVVEVDGERQIHFSHFVTGELLSANRNTLTLIGGKVIFSNGNQIDEGTVQWVNPSGHIEAVLTEKSRFSRGVIALAAILIGSVGAGGWFFMSRQKHGRRIDAQPADACGYCGARLESQGQFCPNCGQKR